LSVPSDAPPDTEFVSVTLRFESVKSAQAEERVASCSSFNNGGVDLEVHHLRLAFVSTINHVLELVQGGNDKKAQAALADITELVMQCQDPRAKALLQVTAILVIFCLSRSPPRPAFTPPLKRRF
jgi:hypothetical protein